MWVWTMRMECGIRTDQEIEGIEIKDVFEGKSSFYARAVLNKRKYSKY